MKGAQKINQIRWNLHQFRAGCDIDQRAIEVQEQRGFTRYTRKRYRRILRLHDRGVVVRRRGECGWVVRQGLGRSTSIRMGVEFGNLHVLSA